MNKRMKNEILVSLLTGANQSFFYDEGKKNKNDSVWGRSAKKVANQETTQNF